MKHFTQTIEWDDVTTSNSFFFLEQGGFSRVVFLCPTEIFDELALLFFKKKKQCWRVLNLFHTKIPKSLTLWLAVGDPLLDPSLRQRFPDIWGNIWWGGEHFINCRENKHSTKQRNERWALGWEQGIQGMMISIIFHGLAGDEWDKDS